MWVAECEGLERPVNVGNESFHLHHVPAPTGPIQATWAANHATLAAVGNDGPLLSVEVAHARAEAVPDDVDMSGERDGLKAHVSLLEGPDFGEVKDMERHAAPVRAAPLDDGKELRESPVAHPQLTVHPGGWQCRRKPRWWGEVAPVAGK